MTNFNLFSKRNIILTLAAALVILTAYAAVKTYRKPAELTPVTYEEQMAKLDTQSESDSTESIEADLGNTDLENLDSELQDIEMELNSSY